MMVLLRSWGNNDENQLDGVPIDDGYVTIACGLGHNVALRNDGTIKSWGYNGDGQLNNVPTDNGYIAMQWEKVIV